MTIDDHGTITYITASDGMVVFTGPSLCSPVADAQSTSCCGHTYTRGLTSNTSADRLEDVLKTAVRQLIEDMYNVHDIKV